MSTQTHNRDLPQTVPGVLLLLTLLLCSVWIIRPFILSAVRAENIPCGKIMERYAFEYKMHN